MSWTVNGKFQDGDSEEGDCITPSGSNLCPNPMLSFPGCPTSFLSSDLSQQDGFQRDP